MEYKVPYSGNQQVTRLRNLSAAGATKITRYAVTQKAGSSTLLGGGKLAGK
jgi:hypothetical protein